MKRILIGNTAALVTEGPRGDCRVTVTNTKGYKKYSGTVPRNDTNASELIISCVIARSGPTNSLQVVGVRDRDTAIPMRTFGHYFYRNSWRSYNTSISKKLYFVDSLYD